MVRCAPREERHAGSTLAGRSRAIEHLSANLNESLVRGEHELVRANGNLAYLGSVLATDGTGSSPQEFRAGKRATRIAKRARRPPR
jgi:hypothetical protein